MAITGPDELQRGDVLIIGPDASSLFAEPFRLRLIAVLDSPTPKGWCLLDGHVLDELGNGVRRRTILVQLAGLLRDDRAGATRQQWRLDNNRGHYFRN